MTPSALLYKSAQRVADILREEGVDLNAVELLFDELTFTLDEIAKMEPKRSSIDVLETIGNTARLQLESDDPYEVLKLLKRIEVIGDTWALAWVDKHGSSPDERVRTEALRIAVVLEHLKKKRRRKPRKSRKKGKAS